MTGNRVGVPAEGAAAGGWDGFLVALSAYVVVSIGRIHQLVPILAVFKPAVLSGVAMLGYFVATRRPAAGWQALDRNWKFLVLGIGVWSALSVPLGIYPGLSFNWWKDVVVQSCLLAVIVAIGLRSLEDIRRVVAAFVLSTGFYSIMILRTFGFNLNERFGSLYSYDTNDFAQIVVCALPFAVYLAIASRRMLGRAVFALMALLCLIIIIKSGSRGGFLGLLAVALLALFTWQAVSSRMRLLALAGGTLFLLAFGSQMFMERVNSILHASEDYNVTSETGRIQAWKRGLGYMLDQPVLGVGVGAFGVAEGTLSELALAARQSGRANVRWMAPHNSFVEIGAEAGIPGLLMFTLLCVLLLRRSLALARLKDAEGRPNPDALLGGALLLSVAGFYVTAFFLSQSYSTHLFFLTGLVAAMTRLRAIQAPLGLPSSPAPGKAFRGRP